MRSERNGGYHTNPAALLILARTTLRAQVAFRRKGWNTMVPEDLNSQQTIVLGDDGQLPKSVAPLLIKGGYGRSVRRWLLAGSGQWGRTITFTAAIICLLTFGAVAGMAQINLAFDYQIGGAVPSPILESITTEFAPLNLTVSTSGESWLLASLSSTTTPAVFTISVDPTGLAVGTYTGTVAVVATGSNTITFNVTLTVTAAALTISASPSVLNYAYQSGGTLPAAQAVTVSASSATAFTAGASGGSWLSVNPTSGSTPASLSVSVNPAGLTAGSYNGTITITASGASNSPLTVNVTLTVTTAALTISASSPW